LGHVILAYGIAIGPKKIEAIRIWTTPINVKEVISFMFHAGYYQIFIKGFSKIAIPITSLQKKGVKFEWNSKGGESFQQLKDQLKSAPILNIAYLDGDFLVCIDASKEGLNGFLTQKYLVVCYESRNVK